MNIREFAIYFAGRAHKDQQYADSFYFFHLEKVDSVLADAGYEPISTERIAGILHDVAEDTDVTLEDIEKYFGLPVKDAVWRVTNEPGVNRVERASKTYPKMVTDESIAIKLADRIANVENSLTSGSRFGLMYLKEHQTFRINFEYQVRAVNHRSIWSLWERYENVMGKVREYYGIAA